LESSQLASPPLATPAILSFLALIKSIQTFEANTVGAGLANYHFSLMPPSMSDSESTEWDCHWERCRVLGQDRFNNTLTRSFRPGSIEGLWEGIFTVK
jgi:hypothetical protein